MVPANRVHVGGKFPKEMSGQQRDILPSLAQRRQHDLHGIDPVIEVMPEFSLRNRFRDVGMGGAEQADVDPDFLRAAKPLKSSVLQHAQQLGLQLRAHFGYLIQQERPAIGQFELAGPGGVGAGERAAFVAEQFAFQQAFRVSPRN